MEYIILGYFSVQKKVILIILSKSILKFYFYANKGETKNMRFKNVKY